MWLTWHALIACISTSDPHAVLSREYARFVLVGFVHEHVWGKHFSVSYSDDIRYTAMHFGLQERSLNLNYMGQMLLLGYGNAVPIKKNVQEAQWRSWACHQAKLKMFPHCFTACLCLPEDVATRKNPISWNFSARMINNCDNHQSRPIIPVLSKSDGNTDDMYFTNCSRSFYIDFA